MPSGFEVNQSVCIPQVPAAAETMRQHMERDGSAPADRLCCEDPLTGR